MALIPAVNQSQTNEAFLFLLTITTPSEVIRVVNNMEDIVSRGETYTAYPFSLSLPADTGDKQPNLQLVIDNTDQALVNAIRGFPKAPSVKVELIVSGSPDIVEKSIDFLQVSSVSYDALSITIEMRPVNILARKFPAASYSSTEFPDLYF